MRQFAIQDIIGEDIGAAVNSDKSIDEALSSALTSCLQISESSFPKVYGPRICEP
jgi:hypothetical protein